MTRWVAVVWHACGNGIVSVATCGVVGGSICTMAAVVVWLWLMNGRDHAMGGSGALLMRWSNACGEHTFRGSVQTSCGSGRPQDGFESSQQDCPGRCRHLGALAARHHQSRSSGNHLVDLHLQAGHEPPQHGELGRSHPVTPHPLLLQVRRTLLRLGCLVHFDAMTFQQHTFTVGEWKRRVAPYVDAWFQY